MAKTIYSIIYANDVQVHLKSIDKKYWKLIKDTIVQQLQHKPLVESKNKKPLSKPPVDNIWEIRFGPNNIFRVFYKADELTLNVYILAVGVKLNNKLRIGKKEIQL